jgi:hypothetical protein
MSPRIAAPIFIVEYERAVIEVRYVDGFRCDARGVTSLVRNRTGSAAEFDFRGQLAPVAEVRGINPMSS